MVRVRQARDVSLASLAVHGQVSHLAAAIVHIEIQHPHVRALVVHACATAGTRPCRSPHNRAISVENVGTIAAAAAPAATLAATSNDETPSLRGSRRDRSRNCGRT